MKDYRYILEKGSKKYICPECNKKKFVRHIDIETGEYLPEQYGRCDRWVKCGYHLDPYKDGYAKMIWEQEQGQNTNNWKPRKPTFKKKQYIKPKPVFIPLEILKQTLSGYEINTFIQNLLTNITFPFNTDEVENVISLYRLGTIQNGYMKGAITFPFIDIQNNVRTVQAKEFDKTNHTIRTNFLHSIIEKHHTRNIKPLPEWLEAYQKNDTKVSCLFGEHLLSRYPYNPIALVEAPKTAIYGTLYFGKPEKHTDLLWLAVYNLSSLTLEKCKALKGRTVYLFPDLSEDGKAFQLWSDKAERIQNQLQGTIFQVSDLLEQLAPDKDREQGMDIADYLITQDWRVFRKEEGTTVDVEEEPEPIKIKINVIEAEPNPIEVEPNVIEIEPNTDWSEDISKLEEYFTENEIPTTIELAKGEAISNVPLFIESHLTIVKSNNGNEAYLPYFERLKKIKFFFRS